MAKFSLLKKCMFFKICELTFNRGEQLRKIDKMFRKLQLAGKLDNIKGLIVGTFTNCPNDNYFEHPKTGNDVIAEALGSVPFPVAYNVSIGHEALNYAIPLGHIAQLTVSKEKSVLHFPN